MLFMFHSRLKDTKEGMCCVSKVSEYAPSYAVP